MDVVTKEVTATATIEPVECDTSQWGEANVILSTQTKDRDGDVLRPEEWMQPLPDWITFDVDHGMSVEKTVGGGTPFINDSGQLQVPVKFSRRDLAQETRTLVNERIIRNVSVSFLLHKNKDGTVKRELLNGAFVAIPANTECVVLSSKGAGGGHKHDEPYGNVAYADPGFRGPKRYPINTPEHVRAAWDYFHHANDRDKYSAAEQHHVEDEIRTAARKFGIKLEGDTKKDAHDVESKAVGDGASDADDEQTGVEAVLRNALTSLKTAVQLHNGQGVPDAFDADDGTYPHLQMIHDAAVQLGGKCSINIAPAVAGDGQVWGANSPTIAAPQQSSGSKSADIPASPAPQAADAAMSPDDTAEARMKHSFIAINLLSELG